MLYEIGNVTPYAAYAEKLPSMPAVAIEVLNMARREQVDLAQISKVIGTDPALSARLLKLSNSSLYGRTRRICTVREAVLTLGLKAVKLAALSFSLTSAVNSNDDLGGYNLNDFWRRAVVQALAARAFSTKLRLPIADEAFTAGLLMDLSVPVLARIAGPKYWPVIIAMEGGHPDLVIETQHVGTTHAVLGGVLLREWKLPDILVNAVSFHHAPDDLPSDCDASTVSVTRILGLAHLASEIVVSDRRGESLRGLTDICARWFGRDAAFVDEVLAELGPDVSQLAQIIGVNLGDKFDATALLEAARAELVNTSLSAASDLDRAESRVAALEAKAAIDGLTNINNRAAFDDRLAAEWERRCGDDLPEPLGMIMIDVDHFKRFNDSFGHQTGDEVLRLVSRALVSGVRDTDILCRYGGEEFAVIAPGASGAALSSLAERLRRKIEAAEIKTAKGVQKITASVGAACLIADPGTRQPKDLIDAADRALYAAKAAGRNRVVIGVELT